MERWEKELETGLEENLTVLRLHHRNVAEYMSEIKRMLPQDKKLAQLHEELLATQQQTEQRYEGALESFRKEKSRWRELMPPR